MESQLGYKSLNRLSFVKLSLNWLLFPHSSCPALIPRLCHLPSPPPKERLLETRATGTISICITHNALERCSMLAATPMPGTKHAWQSKGSLFKLPLQHWQILGVPPSLGYTIQVYIQLSDCLPTTPGQIDLYICLALPAFFLRETEFGRIMHTLQKSQTVPLLPQGPAREDRNSEVMQCLLCSTQPLAAPPTETLLLPEGSTGKYCRF